MDAFPIQNGHVLVVPKLEIDNIFDFLRGSIMDYFLLLVKFLLQ